MYNTKHANTAILQEQGEMCMGLGGTLLSDTDQKRYDKENDKLNMVNHSDNSNDSNVK